MVDIGGLWRRGGQRITAHITTAELQQVLDHGLPESFGPWNLTGYDAVPTGRRGTYEARQWAVEGVNLVEQGLDANGHPRINMWAWSARLTDGLPPFTTGFGYDAACSFSGFIAVQYATHPLVGDGGRLVARDLSVVDALYTDDRRIIEQPDYLRVWRRLARDVRRIATVQHDSPYGARWSTAALDELAQLRAAETSEA